MNKLILIGGGSMAQEVCSWINHQNKSSQKLLTFAGYYDDSGKTSLCEMGVEYLGKIDDVKPCDQVNISFLNCIGEIVARQAIFNKLSKYGFKFHTFVHQSSFIADNVSIGEGCIIGPFSYIGLGSKIGQNTFINLFTSIGHHVHVGNSCVIFSHVDICGYAQLHDCVLIGSNSSVLPKKQIGQNSKVAACSCVSVDVLPNKIHVGGINNAKIY